MTTTPGQGCQQLRETTTQEQARDNGKTEHRNRNAGAERGETATQEYRTPRERNTGAERGETATQEHRTPREMTRIIVEDSGQG